MLKECSNLINSCAPTKEKLKIDVDMLASVDRQFHKDMIVLTEELEHAIEALKSGKSPGHDNVTSEHFKYASYQPSVCIMCIIIQHNCIPDDCINTVMLTFSERQCREYS